MQNETCFSVMKHPNKREVRELVIFEGFVKALLYLIFIRLDNFVIKYSFLFDFIDIDNKYSLKLKFCQELLEMSHILAFLALYIFSK